MNCKNIHDDSLWAPVSYQECLDDPDFAWEHEYQTCEDMNTSILQQPEVYCDHEDLAHFQKMCCDDFKSEDVECNTLIFVFLKK